MTDGNRSAILIGLPVAVGLTPLLAGLLVAALALLLSRLVLTALLLARLVRLILLAGLLVRVLLVRIIHFALLLA
jgi:hypothetical protein